MRRPSQLKAFAHPTRVRVLELLIAAPMTSKQLGDALGMTAARVHYHLKFLEKAELVRLVERSERSGIVEKYYRAMSRKYVISHAVGMFGEPGAVILEALAGAMLEGAESAASGAPVGLVCGANERVRIPCDKLEGLLTVADDLQAAQERLKSVGGAGEGGYGQGGEAARPWKDFELTFALYATGAAGGTAGAGSGGGAAGSRDRDARGRRAGQGS
jgi:DNA-binding transcriptional ArsR family regulator